MMMMMMMMMMTTIMPLPFHLSGEGTFAVTTDREKQLAWIQILVQALTHTYVDRITSNIWLAWGGLLPETEVFMCAIQD